MFRGIKLKSLLNSIKWSTSILPQISHFVQKYWSYHFSCKNRFVIFDITYVDAMKLLKWFQQHWWIIVVYPEKCHSQQSSIRNIYVVYPQQITGACGEWKHSYYVNLKGSKIYIPMSPYSKYCNFYYLCHLTRKYAVQKTQLPKVCVHSEYRNSLKPVCLQNCSG